MRTFFLSALTLCCAVLANASHVVYTPDETGIFPNPERGFTDELSAKVSDSNPYIIQGEESFLDERLATNKERLVVVLYNLYNYKTKDLSEKMLSGFNTDMQVLRDKGFKCVLRFAYTEQQSDKNDAGKDRVLAHLAQLKPYLAQNADVIYVMEAGFVGVWGEWYYSDYFGNETQQLNANRRAVLEGLLDAVPQDRFVLVRYPLIKTQYLGDENTLTAEEAFSGSARAKIGHHNDAFLNKYGNDGTYGRDGDGPDDDPVLRQYIADETLFVPNGGETNVESSSLAKKVYANAPDEMSRYHWSFCGAEYAEPVTSRWRSSGIFDELNRKMGYRYELVSADLPDEAFVNRQTEITITLRNAGYAPLYNARPVFLVLQDGNQTYPIRLQADPRRWLPNGETTVIHETVTIPKEVPVGSYRMWLHLPDAYPSLANDPRYAVRFANIDTWDEETGMNDLKAVLQIRDKEEGTAHIEDISQDRAYKFIRDGQLIIRRGGKNYTITGVETK